MQNHLHDFIISARQWPEHHRKMFAMGVSSVITLAIAVGWVATLPGQFAALLSVPLPTQTQAAAVSLSVVPSPTAAQGTQATPTLQNTFQQGSQIIESMQKNFNTIFSSSTPQSSTATSAAPTAITITNSSSQQEVQNSNPYTNLKYYVSNGVLITNSSAAGTSTATSS